MIEVWGLGFEVESEAVAYLERDFLEFRIDGRGFRVLG